MVFKFRATVRFFSTILALGVNDAPRIVETSVVVNPRGTRL